MSKLIVLLLVAGLVFKYRNEIENWVEVKVKPSFKNIKLKIRNWVRDNVK